MSEFCWPDGQGKQYCISSKEMWDEDIGIYLATVTEKEYPTTFCKTHEENIHDESNISCESSTSK